MQSNTDKTEVSPALVTQLAAVACKMKSRSLTKGIVWIGMLPTITLTLCLMSGTPAKADRGMISIKPWVKLFEPDQNAIVAGNGTEEIIVLTTDVRASEPTDILEVLPLPSEPTVTKGDISTFTRLQALYKRKARETTEHSKFRVPELPGRAQLEPAGEVTFHSQIGAHDVMVTEALNAQSFLSWVEPTLKKLGSKEPKVPAWMQSKIRGYLNDGWHWFVFDSLHVVPNISSVSPIRYRFKTRDIYYPLKITRVEDASKVKLMIMMPDPYAVIHTRVLNRTTAYKSHFFPVPEVGGSNFDQAGRIVLTNAEVADVDPEISALIANHKDSLPRLVIWHISPSHNTSYESDFSLRFISNKQSEDQATIAMYTDEIRRDPQSPHAYWMRGDEYQAAGNYRAAINDYTQVLRLDPGHAGYGDAYEKRASAYEQLRLYQKAIDDYTSAMKLYPDNFLTVTYLNQRARAYEKLGIHVLGQADRDHATSLEQRLRNRKK